MEDGRWALKSVTDGGSHLPEYTEIFHKGDLFYINGHRGETAGTRAQLDGRSVEITHRNEVKWTNIERSEQSNMR